MDRISSLVRVILNVFFEARKWRSAPICCAYVRSAFSMDLSWWSCRARFHGARCFCVLVKWRIFVCSLSFWVLFVSCCVKVWIRLLMVFSGVGAVSPLMCWRTVCNGHLRRDSTCDGEMILVIWGGGVV